MRPAVLDTNIVLDLFVFGDERAMPVLALLDAGELHWIATAAMREELRLVLLYPQFAQRDVSLVLPEFDRRAQLQADPPPAMARCTDADDQKFIDLAVAHRALLLSKDRAVLKMGKRLAKIGVETRAAPAPLLSSP